MRRHLYPKNWEQISRSIRNRSGGQCECAGECGLHNGVDLFDKETRRCVEVNGEKARFARGKIMLTVAHLNHTPMDCRPENLKAMCQRCHLRYDSAMKAERRKRPWETPAPLSPSGKEGA